MIPAADRAVTTKDNITPFLACEADVEDLFVEASHHLDGKPIENDGQAEAVARILDSARKTWKAADEQRKAEKRPHDEAAQAVQDQWNPLLAKARQIETAAKNAQTAWLEKKDAEQRAAAARAREEAEERLHLAQAALAEAKGDDLSARATAEQLLKEAGQASKLAARLDKAKPQSAGGSRAVGLRTSWTGEVTDYTKFSRWAWVHRRSEYEAWLRDLAEREAKRGPVEIPGIIIKPKRKAA